jgi:hypothetical protein
MLAWRRFKSSESIAAMANPLLLPLLDWARKLRYPTLFKITACLFLVTLVIPDPFPFVDEILFGLGTLLLANWKRRKEPAPSIEPSKH